LKLIDISSFTKLNQRKKIMYVVHIYSDILLSLILHIFIFLSWKSLETEELIHKKIIWSYF